MNIYSKDLHFDHCLTYNKTLSQSYYVYSARNPVILHRRSAVYFTQLCVQQLGKMTIATIPEAEIGICIVVSPTLCPTVIPAVKASASYHGAILTLTSITIVQHTTIARMREGKGR
jgi:hypothetical protein